MNTTIPLRNYRAKLRRRRNEKLSRLIERLHARKGAKVRTLDVGGSPFFWETVENSGKCDITLLNQEHASGKANFTESRFTGFRLMVGDGRCMPEIGDNEYDLVVSNSTIEHVGGWSDIERCCAELWRVGRNGWVRTPAWEFPIEPHFLLPFCHWFARPVQRRLLQLFGRRGRRPDSITAARQDIESINLVSWAEFRFLFPNAEILCERFLLMPKSFVAVWQESLI